LRLLVFVLPAVLSVIIGIVIVVAVVIANSSNRGISSNWNSPSTTSAAPELHNAAGLNALLALTREQFGDTIGYELTVFHDYAIIDRADPNDTRRVLNYMYRGGDWKSWSTPSSRFPSDVLADLSTFDVTAVIATLASAPQLLDLKNPDNTYLIVRGADGGNLELSIYVSDHGLSGWMEVNPDGSVKELHPPT
jgi:hypothetical protein